MNLTKDEINQILNIENNVRIKMTKDEIINEMNVLAEHLTENGKRHIFNKRQLMFLKKHQLVNLLAWFLGEIETMLNEVLIITEGGGQ